MQDDSLRLKNIIKLDAFELLRRLELRKESYLSIFSIKRSRDHFCTLFEHKFSTLSADLLMHLSEEEYTTCNEFYTEVSDFEWYLKYTEEMPSQIEDRAAYMLSQLKHRYENVLKTFYPELNFNDEVIESIEVEETI